MNSVIAGSFDPIWSYSLANCGTTNVIMKMNIVITRNTSTDG